MAITTAPIALPHSTAVRPTPLPAPWTTSDLGMQAGAPAQGAVRRAVGDGEPGGGHVVHVVGQRDHVLGARHRLLGEGAVGDHGQYPLPALQPRTPAPTASISPASSRPGVNGKDGFSW